jgi:hypothetical protein
MFTNDWNPGWGDDGYGYFPYAYMTDGNLSGDLWVLNGIPGGPPIPPQPPVVTGDVLTLTTTLTPQTINLPGYGALVIVTTMTPGQYLVTPAGVVPTPPIPPTPTGETLVLKTDVRANQYVKFLNAHTKGIYTKTASFDGEAFAEVE